MRELNKDIKARDTIIFGNYDAKRYSGGIARYEFLPLAKLEKLAAEGFVDLDETQNSSPSIEEFLEFMRQYPDYTAHGYVVCLERDDYRVSVEGIEKSTPADSQKELGDFVNLARCADEFDTNGVMYCWYD